MSSSPMHAPVVSRFPSLRRRHHRVLALAIGAPFSILCVASVFWMQVGLLSLWHEWMRADASLAMIALGALAAGPLLAFCLGE